MADENNAALQQNRLELAELNGPTSLNIGFDDNREDVSIELTDSEMEYLSTELNYLHNKALIASEYGE